MVYVKSRHKLPEFLAAVTITINFMVMAAPAGDTFSTVFLKNRFIPLLEPDFIVMVTVTVDRWRRSYYRPNPLNRAESAIFKTSVRPRSKQVVLCYTRSTPSYKLLIEYNLLLTQRLTSYPLVLGVLHCGSSSFARVTNELPLGVLWLLCVAGTSFARSPAQLSCPPLSLATQLSESKAAAYVAKRPFATIPWGGIGCKQSR
jgi:hypothetical protein